MTRRVWHRAALLACCVLGTTAAARAQVRVGVEQSRDHALWHFDNPSSYDTTGLVPHFFEQDYTLDNLWLTADASYRAGIDWHTSIGVTPVRRATATDYDTFFNPGGVVWVSGTTGLAKVHGFRLAQAVDLGRIGRLRLTGGYSLRVDRADFLDGERTDVRDGAVVVRRVVTSREFTSGQSHDVFIEGTHTSDLSPTWRLRVGGQASPASVHRLAIQLPDKYPGRTIVFRTTNLTVSGRVELVRGQGRWPFTVGVSGLRTVNYSRRQSVDRSRVNLGVGIGRTW